MVVVLVQGVEGQLDLHTDLHVVDGQVYVGTIGPDDRGTLWGPRRPAPVPSGAGSPSPPPQCGEAQPEAPGALLAQLDQALGAPAEFSEYRRRLFAVLRPLAASRSPSIGRALAARLSSVPESGAVSAFGGTRRVSLARAGRWYLLWAIALNGHGHVPAELIGDTWPARPNPPEKYFEPAPGAAWAAAELDQGDPDTLSALVDGLQTPATPLWLKGDYVGALTALTGRRYGYDFDAWQRWRASGP